MTKGFDPDITFLLGPPADPELRARFENAQKCSDRAGGSAERCLQLEPRLEVLLAERSGRSSLVSELFSLILRTPVRIVDPFLAFGLWKGLWVASFQLRPAGVLGPARAVARLFQESEPAHATAAALGLVLKLDWVQTLRRLPAHEEDEEGA